MQVESGLLLIRCAADSPGSPYELATAPGSGDAFLHRLTTTSISSWLSGGLDQPSAKAMSFDRGNRSAGSDWIVTLAGTTAASPTNKASCLASDGGATGQDVKLTAIPVG